MIKWKIETNDSEHISDVVADTLSQIVDGLKQLGFKPIVDESQYVVDFMVNEELECTASPFIDFANHIDRLTGDIEKTKLAIKNKIKGLKND
jgi:transcription antitermination factor NusG